MNRFLRNNNYIIRIVGEFVQNVTAFYAIISRFVLNEAGEKLTTDP